MSPRCKISIVYWDLNVLKIEVSLLLKSDLAAETGAGLLMSSIDCYTVTARWHSECQCGLRNGLQLTGITILWLVGPNIGWACLMPHRIMGSHDWWEFPPFFRSHWQSLCTAPVPAVQDVQGDCERVYVFQERCWCPWTLDKMAEIMKRTFSNLFLWMKICVFWFEFTEACCNGINDSSTGLVWNWQKSHNPIP